MLAEDQPIIRRGLTGLIHDRPDFHLASVATNGEEALDAIIRDEPDVAVIGVRLPHDHGHAVLTSVRARGLLTPIVFTTGESLSRQGCLVAGAAASISIAGDDASIAAALIRASREPVHTKAPRARAHASGLSMRELEALELAAGGRTNIEIATAMYVSAATARTYLHRACEKLGQRNRTAAVAYGIRSGLIG